MSEDRTLIYNSQCYKVILCDTNDEIIDVQASFLVGVARELCHQQRHIRKQQLKAGGLDVGEENIGIMTSKDLQRFYSEYKFLVELEHNLNEHLDDFLKNLQYLEEEYCKEEDHYQISRRDSETKSMPDASTPYPLRYQTLRSKSQRVDGAHPLVSSSPFQTRPAGVLQKNKNSFLQEYGTPEQVPEETVDNARGSSVAPTPSTRLGGPAAMAM